MDGNTLIAMSGGVDSSVAAWLLMERGYNCIGAMMKLYSEDDESVEDVRTNSCCSLADAEDARAVALRLGIPFYVFNFTEHFAEQVIDRFVGAYQRGFTPNPCIDCNRYLKFERFMERARTVGCDRIATGHYARIGRQGERYVLKRGIDITKDQSYVLYAMTQEQLAATFFPLGELEKSEVREIALEKGFINAKKHDSQDICFVPDRDYVNFIENYSGQISKKGRLLDTKGNDLGEHKGICHYTIGQRKGLGLSSETPLYVCAVCPEDNTVIVGAEEELYSKALIARDINMIAVEKLTEPLRVTAKIRYSQQDQPATVWQLDDDILRVEFDSAKRAITKGQAVVLYDGDTVIGGGMINGGA